MSAVVVTIPTVAPRRAVLAQTLRDWHALGFAPLITEQPRDVPLGHAGNTATCRAALAAALATQASHIILAEDDIHVSRHLPARLPGLVEAATPSAIVTLFVPGNQHYSAAARRGIATRTAGLYTVTGRSAWYGSQTLLMHRHTVEALLARPSRLHGFDMHVRAWLLETGAELLVAVPNLVQQRDVPPVSNPRGGKQRSTTFDAGGA